jgi:hypothetical protein
MVWGMIFNAQGYKSESELVVVGGDLCIKINGGLIPTTLLKVEGGVTKHPEITITFYPTNFIGLEVLDEPNPKN